LTCFGTVALTIAGLLLGGSLGITTINYLAKSTRLPEISDRIARRINQGQLLWSSSGAQLFYGIKSSPDYRGTAFPLKPLWPQLFLPLEEWRVPGDQPPLMVMQDGVNVAVSIHESESRDLLRDRSIDTLRAIMQKSPHLARSGKQIFAAAEDFYTSPYYYLEMLYSWRSYTFLHELMPWARDSVYLYLFHPVPARGAAPDRNGKNK
jgi:hypothetical protein